MAESERANPESSLISYISSIFLSDEQKKRRTSLMRSPETEDVGSASRLGEAADSEEGEFHDSSHILPPAFDIKDQGSSLEAAQNQNNTDANVFESEDMSPSPDATGLVTIANVIQEPDSDIPLFRNRNGTYLIRLTPYVDLVQTLAALYFGPVVRKLKPGSTIAIGRYTEKNKDALNASSSLLAPVVFKSKVVSRTHAEILVDENGCWTIRDLRSSLGTFLNHRRLLAANTESEPLVLNEGDLLQLGMDFRGGAEEIYRCVRMRVELNKLWIRRTKAFSKEAQKRMEQLSPEWKDQMQCVICLDDIQPCQAVFVSPCLHSYHYKCIRRVILKSYPQFLCPTCRALSDLEAEDESDSDTE